jgi:hypothetical protein
MDNIELRKLLQQLDAEVKNTQAVDEKGSELLHDLEGDISALLERSDENPVQLHPTSIKHMESALDHFETTHPSLTELISKLLESLSNVGI